MKPEDILKLSRNEVRYCLYRIRNEAEGGALANEDAAPIRWFFEQQPGFLGWAGFARTWDVGEEGKHDLIMAREITEEQDWNRRLNEAAVVINGG